MKTKPWHLLCIASVVLSGAPLYAQSLYWPSESDAGTWSILSPGWSSTPGGSPTQNWSQGADAYFQGINPSLTLGTDSAYSVTVNDLSIANGLTLIGNGSNRVLVIQGSATGNLTAAGTGSGSLRVELLGENAYSGIISASGRASNLIYVNDANATGTATRVHLEGGTLSLGGNLAGQTLVIGELSGTSGLVAPAAGEGATGGRTLRIEQSTYTSFHGNLNQASSRQLSIVKAGTGTLQLHGTSNTFGSVIVEAGALYVNGTHSGQNSHTVKSGATLGGSGSISFNTSYGRYITFEADSILDPGTPTEAGTLTIGGALPSSSSGPGLYFSSGESTIRMRLGTNQDLILLANPFMAGGAAAGASILFDFSDNGGTLVGETYTLMTFGSSIASPGIGLDAFALSSTSITAGWDGTFFYDDHHLKFTVATIPEPAHLALLFLGGLIACHRRLRFR